MDAATVINLGYAAAFGLAGVTLIRLSRRRPTLAERIAAARKRVGFTVWDFETEEWLELPPGTEPGPLQMTGRDIAKADPLELLYLSRAYDRASAAIDEGMARLFEELGPPVSSDPMEAGLDRLRDAIRNDQTEEDQP